MVAQRLLGEMRYSAVEKALMEQFHIADRTARRTIEVARINLAAIEEQQRPFAQAVACERLERLVDRAEAAGDFRGAVLAYRELIRVRGLAAPDRIHHSGGLAVAQVTQTELDAIDDMTPEQLKVLAMLDAKAPQLPS